MTTIAFLFIGFLIALILLFYPDIATWVMLVMAMAVAGTITFFYPEFAMIRWSVVPVSLALLIRSILSIMTYTPASKRISPPFFLYCFGLLFVVVCLSTLVNFQLKETLIASKNFFQFWSIPLAFVYVIQSKKTIPRVMTGLLFIAAIEPILAIIQYLFFSGRFPGDSVTGTFGGQIAGGGPNAALSIYMIIQIVTVLALTQKNLLKKKIALPLILWFLVPVLLNNAKVAVICFPIIFFILYGKDFLKKPVKGFLVIVFLTSMGFGVFYYHYLDSGKYRAEGKPVRSLYDYVDRVISYNIEGKQRGKKLSRLASISFWWKENSFVKDPVRMLIGHGLGATKQSGIILGHVANKSRYRHYEIGRFALPRLLWDLGLVGTFLFIIIYLNAFFTAGRLKKEASIPPFQQAFLAGAQMASLLFLLTLPYKSDIINVQAFNAFSMFIIGYIAFWAIEITHINNKIDSNDTIELKGFELKGFELKSFE